MSEGVNTPVTTLYQGVPGTAETTMYAATAPTEITEIRIEAEDSTGTTITIHFRRMANNAVPAAAAGNVFYQSGTITTATAAVDAVAVDEPLAMAPGDVLSAIEGSASHVLAVTVLGRVHGSA